MRVEVDGPEVPVLDGSAAPFVILLHEAGLRPLAVPRQLLRVKQPVEVVHGAKGARLVPSEHFEVSYSIGFDHPLLRHQALALRVTPRSFTDQIAPARTFGFLREVELLRKSGLALGGSLENAVVIGETGVLNNKLRFEDEFVRHKILDAIGDLALLGHPLVGRLEATRAGHALHAAVANKLLATPGAFELVPAGAHAAPLAPLAAQALRPAGTLSRGTLRRVPLSPPLRSPQLVACCVAAPHRSVRCRLRRAGSLRRYLPRLRRGRLHRRAHPDR